MRTFLYDLNKKLNKLILNNKNNVLILLRHYLRKYIALGLSSGARILLSKLIQFHTYIHVLCNNVVQKCNKKLNKRPKNSLFTSCMLFICS